MITVAHALEAPDGGLWLIASHRERRPRRGRRARGLTPAVLAARAGLGDFDGLPTVCLVGTKRETPIPVAQWETLIVPDGTPVVFLSRPMGGRGGSGGGGASPGKAIGAAVAAIALAVIAPYAVGAIGAAGAGFLGTVGALTTAGQIASAVLVAGGGMLISHFMAPKAGGKNDTPQNGPNQSIYNVTSQGNRPRPQQTIPVGYGRCIHPLDYAAPPTSVFTGNNQEEWNLFVLGCGDYSVEELRIGDTTVWTSASGVVSGYSGLQVELLPPGSPCTIFPTNFVPNTDVSSVTIPQNGNNTAEQIVNASGTQTDSIYVSFAWSRSYSSWSWKGQSGNSPVTTSIYVDYALVDAGGSQIGGWTTFGQSFSLLTQTGHRHTVTIGVTPGRYKIRVRATGLSDTNELGMIGVSARLTGAQPGLDQYRIAVKRTAGPDQQGLTGTWVAIPTRKVDVWNGAAWVSQTTRNPVWAALDIWTDPDYGANQPLTNVDLATMISLATFADQQQYYFDHWFTSQMDLDEALRTCLRVMLAFPVYTLNKLSATYDGVRGAPAIHFTDGEIVRGSMQRGIKLYRNDFADGVILEYLDETTWRAADVKSGDGLNNPGRIQIPGVTRRAQAAWLARRHAAETNYRRIEADWEVEGEAKLLHIGDMVRVTTSEPQAWTETLLGVSYNAGTQIITVDRAPAWDDAAASHWVQIRRRNGKAMAPIRCVKNVSAPLELVLTGSDVAAAEAAAGVTLDATINRASLEDQCTMAFSPASARRFDVLIKELRRNGPNRFTISGVVDNAAVYDADTGSVASLPTLPPVIVNAVPTIARLEARMFQSGPNCMLAGSWRAHPGAVHYIAEVSYDEKASWVRIASNLTVPTFQVFTPPADLYLRVAGVSSSGIQGNWAETAKIIAPLIVINGDVLSLSIAIDDLVQDLKDKVIGGAGVAGSIGEAKAIADRAAARSDQIRLALSSDPAENARVTEPMILGLRDDVNLLTSTMTTMQGRLETLRSGLIEAGYEVESAEGRARIYGVSTLQNQVNQLSIDLNALTGTLTLYAQTFVSGDVVGLINTINAVQVQLNSVEASLTSYVTTATLNEATARVTTLENSMTAANSAIATKASLTTVTDQGARLTTAENSLSAISGILNTVTSAQVQLTDLNLVHATISQILEYIGTIQGEQVTQFGIATNNLSAFIDDAGRQIAQQSVNLAVVAQNATAQFANLSQAIASGDTALANSITSLSAQVNHVSTGLPATLAALNSEISTRAAGDSANAASIAALSAQVNHATTGLPATYAAVGAEATARANADTALSGSISSVSATVNGLTSSVVQFAAASATPGGYSAAYDIKVNTGATYAGLTIAARGDGTSAVIITASDLVLKDPAGSLISPFYVSGGVVYIEEARIKRGTVSEVRSVSGTGLSHSLPSVVLEAGTVVVLIASVVGDPTIGTGDPSGKAITMSANGGGIFSQPIFMMNNSPWTNIMPPQVAMHVYTVPSSGTYTFAIAQNHASGAVTSFVAHIYKK